VSVPPQLGVDAGDDHAGDGDAAAVLAVVHRLPAGPMLVHQSPLSHSCIQEDSLEGQLPPELARLVGVLGNAGTLAVELVVLGAGKLLGALGAVVSGWAGRAKGSGTLGAQGHARGGAGEHALGEHRGRLWSGDGGWCRSVVGDGMG
jgi:hypothetical protein